jgi:hypothetical protein
MWVEGENTYTEICAECIKTLYFYIGEDVEKAYPEERLDMDAFEKLCTTATGLPVAFMTDENKVTIWPTPNSNMMIGVYYEFD